MNHREKVTFTLAESSDKKQRIVCHECRRETQHSIVASFDENGDVDHGDGNAMFWSCQNQIIQCCGCETVSFRTISTCSEDAEYDNDGTYLPETIKYYPGMPKRQRTIETFLLPSKVQEVYKETLIAIENEQFILSGVGIRTIIEIVCKDRNASGKNLYRKIDSLKELSIVTAEGAETLHKLRNLGNKAAHDANAYDSRQLELAMTIIEHMLEGAYIIPTKVHNTLPS